MNQFAPVVKIVLYLVGGAVVGTVLGYVSQCTGGSCPLMCVWWRGAIFGAVAGGAIYFAAKTDSGKRDTRDHE